MKSIHAIFTDEEHKKIAEKKEESGLNWHDFILELIEEKMKREVKNGTKNKIQD